VIIDIDDNYKLGGDHPMSLTANKEKWHEPIVQHLRRADYVTTTTPIFAKLLRKHNKNVRVFPNAINPDEEQYKLPKTPETDRLRVGIICGSSHLKDLELLKGITQQVDLDKVQFVLCGFDTRGTRTIYHQDTGQKEVRQIHPEESVWCDYERIFTDDYKTISEDHKKFLMMYASGVDDSFTNEPYRRMWTRDISKYATHYANVDVLLAPLKVNDFNEVKSELKEIECGFTHTAFIGQNFGAYTINLTNMIEKGGKINEEGTALLVDPTKNHKQWGKYINKLANDRDMLHKLQDNLQKFVVANYSLGDICKKRVEFYKSIVNGK
jgi:glycosyltransferase involved in cell wall biosynthesis